MKRITIIAGFLFIVLSFAYAQSDTAKAFTIVEIQPQFPGGDEALMMYLAKNITYPIEAKEQGIQGTVFVTFIIETDGSLSNIKILRGIGGGCDEEVIRVVKNMPEWKPGYHNNEVVRVLFNLPVRFILQGGDMKLNKKKKQKK